MMQAGSPMPYGRSATVSRRSVFSGLAALTATACSKLVFVAANVPAAFGSYTRHAHLAYGGDRHQRVDVYVPEGRAPGGPRPLVVFWYGGRWTTGDKDDYRFVGAALAGMGYVAVLPNYRHYPAVKMTGFMDDAALAVLWARDHGAEFGADPQRLYLMGHSAGAHIAALVSLDPRYFAATGRTVPHIAGLIGLSGPYDFLPLTDADLEDMFGPPERYEQSQPIHFVSRHSPPAFLVHGLKDQSVAPKNSVNLAAALNAHGVRAELKLYATLSHADTVAALSLPARGRAPILSEIAAFVGPAGPLGAVGSVGALSPSPSS
jgi:acetyl esterase/lipase